MNPGTRIDYKIQAGEKCELSSQRGTTVASFDPEYGAEGLDDKELGIAAAELLAEMC